MWCWRRLLRVPWTARRSNQSILKEISREYSLEGLMLKLKPQYFGHLMGRTDSFERPWCWERLKAGEEGDDEGWDGWMTSLTFWTWVWASSRSWWWTGKSGILQPMGSQRVRHDWATELKWPIMEYYSALKKKKMLVYATRWINLEDFMHKKTINVWCHLNEVSRVVKLIETENRKVVSKGWKEGKISCGCLIGAGF